jgi:hypothetical protein
MSDPGTAYRTTGRGTRADPGTSGAPPAPPLGVTRERRHRLRDSCLSGTPTAPVPRAQNAARKNEKPQPTRKDFLFATSQPHHKSTARTLCTSLSTTNTTRSVPHAVVPTHAKKYGYGMDMVHVTCHASVRACCGLHLEIGNVLPHAVPSHCRFSDSQIGLPRTVKTFFPTGA